MFVKGEPGSLSWASSAFLMALDRIETTARMGVSPDGFASTRLVILKGYGHYEVYTEPAFSEVTAATLAWYRQYLPSR
jgi:hypothetical protein